jgi:ribosome-binding factor A
MPHTKRLEEGGGIQHFREALAQVVREVVEFPPGAFVTVLDAKITRDTKHAKGIISVLPVEMENEVLKLLKEAEHDIKEGLGETLRLRRIPRLHWGFDRTEDHAADIDQTIAELQRKGEL